MSTGDATRDHDGGGRAGRLRDQLTEVEALCEEFELAWKAGRDPVVDDFLRDHGLERATAPAALVAGLDKLEAWYKERRPFAPGTVLAGRYRVEVVLGEGGMGVVYRARDQFLRRLVALKFLPGHLAADPERREQILREVGAAREVTHDCVARVHDIGEHEGRLFLSMEYIAGRDLASVLRLNSGRLAEGTAAKYAWQLCVGLAAIHKRGVVHRDLKPQNIMIDEGGGARIIDFGLVGPVGSFTGDAVRAGTPLYQSPEQLAGTEVTPRSDVFSLGLVLYEMYTGRRAFEAAHAAELLRRHRDGPPAAPSSHVPNLDPAVDTIIRKCLEREPSNRPQSATEVLQAVPDWRLGEAISRGVTPTSNEVSEAWGHGRLSKPVGVALLALALVGALLAAWLNDHAALFRRELTELGPRALSREARRHLRNLGHTASARDSACGIATDEAALKSPGPGAPPMYFWYRESPDVLAQRLSPNDTSGWSMPGRVLPNEPPLRGPGMTCVFLGPDGRLLELHAVPPVAPEAWAAREPDPAPLLEAAGLKGLPLHESKDRRRVPPVFADRWMAWDITPPNAAPLRAEAAFCRGRPVYFSVGPPDHPDRLHGGSEFIPGNLKERLLEVEYMLLGLIALPIGGWYAWGNWKKGRANPRGASILAACFVGLGMVGWLLAAHHVVWPNDKLALLKDELSMFTGVLGRALFDGLLLWLTYLALEPWVRETNRGPVISWNRLLLGKWDDPLVGRDVLIGVAGGAGFVALLQVLRAAPGWLGHDPGHRVVWEVAFTEGRGPWSSPCRSR